MEVERKRLAGTFTKEKAPVPGAPEAELWVATAADQNPLFLTAKPMATPQLCHQRVHFLLAPV